MKYKKNEITTISVEEAEWLAKSIGNSLHKWMKAHPNTTAEVMSDIAESSLTGFISGKCDNRKIELESTPGTGEMFDGDY